MSIRVESVTFLAHPRFVLVCDNPERSGYQCDACSGGTCKNCGECLGQHPIMRRRQEPCVRCGDAHAPESFDLCADKNALRALCTECDIALNELVLRWVNDPDVDSKVAAYRQEKNPDAANLRNDERS